MLKESDILHETGRHWIVRNDRGDLEVYRNGVTHSTRCATIGFRDRPDYQMERAIAECDRREYADWLKECQQRQRAYIASEKRKMAKLQAAWRRYVTAAHGLGFHPLTATEIGDRLRELDSMESRVAETHGDSDAMRAIYETRRHSAAA